MVKQIINAPWPLVKFCRSPKSNSLYSLLIVIFSFKIWVKLDENCGWTGLLKILALDIFQGVQSAPNDPKLSSRNQTWKAPYIHIYYDRETQIFIHFALQTAVFKRFNILWLSHWLPCRNSIVPQFFLKLGLIAKNVIACIANGGYCLYVVCPKSDEHCRGSGVLKFPAHIFRC